MAMKRKTLPNPPSKQAIQALLDKYACPVPYHEIRTRFLGNIATPVMVSPLQIVKSLWGGEMPVFGSIDEANELINILINGLWNGLTKHQKRNQPFRLTRPVVSQTANGLAELALIRQQELEGFATGLFNGAEYIDLPERAHEAMTHLGEMRAMMEGIVNLVKQGHEKDDSAKAQKTLSLIRDLTRIMETEINAAVLSCTRARRQPLGETSFSKPILH